MLDQYIIMIDCINKISTFTYYTQNNAFNNSSNQF